MRKYVSYIILKKEEASDRNRINCCLNFRLIKLVLLLMVLPASLFAQNNLIKGKVTATDGETLIGVNVLEKGTSNGTVTNTDGEYSLQLINSNTTLIFSYVGYAKVEKSASGQRVIDVILPLENDALDEVVLIGYSTVKKKDLTGAVSVVSSEKLDKVQAMSVAEVIQGQASGISIRNNGDIASEANIKIRGLGSFENYSPLYVVDGLIFSGGLRDLNVNDIESVQVLKDASTASIYGNRAANGVIIITTKKGSNKKTQIDFSAKFGIEKLAPFNMMDTTEFFYYNDMAYDNAGVARQNHYDSNTDWEKEILCTGYSQEYNVGVSGGSADNKYYLSGGYLSRNGTSIGTSMNRISVRVNNEMKKGILTIGENFAISDFGVVPASISPISSVLRLTPDIPIYDSSHPGGYGYGDEDRARTFGSNYIAAQDLINIKSGNTRIRGNVFGELELFKFLKYKLSVGYETSIDRYYSLRKEGNYTLNQATENSYLYESRNRYQSVLYDNTLNFDKTFGNHAISAILGTSFQKESVNFISGKTSDIVTVGGEYLDVLDQGTTNPTVGGYRTEIDRISYFGRLNYTYKDKYLFSSSLRRDASSQFAEDYRVGYFPSVSVGWRISKEDFYAIPWMTDLKIRANYGELGNAYSGAYDYMAVLTTNPLAIFGADGEETVLNGVTQRELVNSDLTWETKIQKNFGVDMAFLENKFLVSADYFISTTKDVLVEYPILLATGNDGGNPLVNAGSLQNKGVELELSYKNQINDFKYSITANFTHLSNKVLDLPYGDSTITESYTKTQIGEPMAMFYLVKTDGIFQSEEEVQSHVNSEGAVIQPNAKPGDLRYIDYNNDGSITQSGDRQIVGSPWPKFELGLNFNAEYKNFDLAVSGFGSFGQKVWDGVRSLTEGFSDNSNYRKGINPWTSTNTNTDFPRPIYGDDRNSVGYIDRWLEDGSFFRIQNIALGYNLKLKALQKYLDDVHISISGQNLFTFTKYQGLDAGFNNSDVLNFGCDYVNYPTPRTYLLSLSVKF